MEAAKSSSSSSARLAPILALPAPVKAAVVATKKSAAEKTKTDTAARRRLFTPAQEDEGRAPPRFACGEDVEVRTRLARVPSGRWLVIYVRAKVVSASASADAEFYAVQYPAAKSVPSRVVPVPAADVREPRRVPLPPPPAAAPARPAKRPPPESERGGADG